MNLAKAKTWSRDLAKRAGSLSPHGDIKQAFRSHKKSLASEKAKTILRFGLASAESPTQRSSIRTSMKKVSKWGKKYDTQLYTSSKSAAKKIAGIGVGVTALAFARKAYKARKAQVNLKPTYRQYDVYPEHEHAVVPAHKTNRPYYDDYSGGRTVPRYEATVRSILDKNSLLESRFI